MRRMKMIPYYWDRKPDGQCKLYDWVERYHIDIFGGSNYPLFDDEHRKELEDKIYEHYKWFRPFTDNPTEWTDRFNALMNEIMEHNNELYESALHKLDPFVTESVRERSDTKHKQKRKTGYMSGFQSEAGHTEQDDNVSRETLDSTGNLDTTGTSDTVSDEGVKTHDEGSKHSVTDYNEDTTLDTTKDVSSVSNEKTAGTSNTKTTGKKVVDGNSTTNTTNHSDTTFTESKKHADTPQTDLSSIGNYWSDHTQTDSNTVVDSTGKQDVTSHETTDTNDNTDGTTSGTKDTTGTTDESGNQKGNKDSTSETNETTENDGTKDTQYKSNVSDIGNEQSTSHSDRNTRSTGGRTSQDNSRNQVNSYEDRSLGSGTEYELKLKGFRNRTPADLIKEYRTALIDVDLRVIRQLRVLFNPNLY